MSLPMRTLSRFSLLLFLFVSVGAYTQHYQYRYKRDILEKCELWNQIDLPDDLFGKVSKNLSDIRIYGITSSGDSIEVPYLLKYPEKVMEKEEISIGIINVSNNAEGFFYTFDMKTIEPINQMDLQLNLDNFDFKLKLEGSNDQLKWYTLMDNYRILSIKNEAANFTFSRVNFPDSKYRYFRLMVYGAKNPELISAKIFHTNEVRMDDKTLDQSAFMVKQGKLYGETELEVVFRHARPVSSLQFFIADKFDYFRGCSIMALVDSVKTDKGWFDNYILLTSASLSSASDNVILFNSTITRKLKVIVHNLDNQPLRIDSVTAKGHVYSLQARFPHPGQYFICYGNSSSPEPKYDLYKFRNSIPNVMPILTLGKEQLLDTAASKPNNPFFINKAWLWGTLVILVLLLGWFSFSMISKNH
jgi:hypothetical protein